jgi:hypothetical protein
VERWLLLVPGLVVVVTSRIDLGCAAEHRFELEPLAPDAATALFRARAGARHASRRSEDDSGWARLIAESLHGVPLAIELAAGRTLVSSPREIADSLRRPRGVAELVPLPGSSIRVLERDGNILIASGIDHACLDLGPAPLLSVASSVIASPSSSSVVTRPSYLCSAGARSSCSALGTDQRRSRDTSA